MKRAPLLVAAEELLPQPQQSRSILKRRRMLDAARHLFGEKGYDATSIEEITSRAGTASGAFYTYFRSKRQLLLILMNDLLQRLEHTDLHPTGGTELRDFLLQLFNTDLEYFGVIRAWHEASLIDAELAAMRHDIEAWTEDRILRLFRMLAEAPNARPYRDVQTFARMMDRHFWGLLARGGSLSKKTFVREVGVAADVITHYFLRDGRDQ
jgi:AcrR family transcriptional regulator